jgi:hypothetical protein
LIPLRLYSTLFSECPLKSLRGLADFDSTIRRFESSRPSQLVRTFAYTARSAEKSPHLAGFRTFGKVSGWRNRPRAPPNSRKSPADSFDIPVFGSLRVETGFDHTAARGR